MNLRVGKIIGRIDGRRWGQVHDFLPADEEKAKIKGRLVAVVSFVREAEDQVGAVEEGREVLSRLHEKYFGTEGESLLVLRKAVEETNQEFDGAEAVAIAVVEDKVFVAGTAGTGVWVKNGRGQGFVISPGEDNIAAFTGRGEEKMKLVLGNSGFWRKIGKDVLEKAVSGKVDDAAEMLGAIIHAEGAGGGEAGAVAEIEKEEISAAEVIVEEKPFRRKKSLSEILEEAKAKLPGRRTDIFVSPEDRHKRKKRTMYAGLAALLFLVILVVGGQARGKNIAMKNSETNKKIEQLLAWYEDARAVLPLNPKRSAQLLRDVEAGVKELENKKVEDKRLAEVKSGLGDVLGAASGIKNVTVAEVVDLGLVREGTIGSYLAISGDKLVVLDTNNYRLLEIDRVKKSGKVIAGADAVGQARGLLTYPGKIMVWGDKGVVQIVEGKGEVKIIKDSGWKEITDGGMFAGNIYLLDKGANQIWRYAVAGSGYGSKQAWIAENEKTDFSGVKRMTIDGSIWMVNGSSVLKYTRGVKDEFTIDGLDKGFGDGAAAYTNDDLKRLYILDKTNNRIVILDKSGAYERQLVSGDLGGVADFTADETAGKIYVLKGNILGEINL